MSSPDIQLAEKEQEGTSTPPPTKGSLPSEIATPSEPSYIRIGNPDPESQAVGSTGGGPTSASLTIGPANQTTRGAPGGRGGIRGGANYSAQAEAIAGEGFSYLEGFFAGLFTVGYASAEVQNKLTGRQVIPIEQNQLLGIKATDAKAVIAQNAAYLFPGGAILHGVGDTGEATAARILDVGTGVLIVLPELGLTGRAAGIAAKAASLPGRAAIGAAFGATYSVAQGETDPGTIAENALFTAGFSVGFGYGLKGASGLTQRILFRAVDRPLVNLGGDIREVGRSDSGLAPRTEAQLSRGFTEEGKYVPTGEEARVYEPIVESGAKGSGLGNLTEYLKAAVPKQGATPEDITTALAGRSEMAAASRIVSLEAALGPEIAAKVPIEGRLPIRLRLEIDETKKNLIMRQGVARAFGSQRTYEFRFGGARERIAVSLKGLRDEYSQITRPGTPREGLTPKESKALHEAHGVKHISLDESMPRYSRYAPKANESEYSPRVQTKNTVPKGPSFKAGGRSARTELEMQYLRYPPGTKEAMILSSDELRALANIRKATSVVALDLPLLSKATSKSSLGTTGSTKFDIGQGEIVTTVPGTTPGQGQSTIQIPKNPPGQGLTSTPRVPPITIPRERPQPQGPPFFPFGISPPGSPRERKAGRKKVYKAGKKYTALNIVFGGNIRTPRRKKK